MGKCPPIIIIGMSRSGTGLLTKILEGLGLFVVSKKESNHEYVFFHKLNKWFLSFKRYLLVFYKVIREGIREWLGLKHIAEQMS